MERSERLGIEDVGKAVVDAALKLHRHIGPGLLESVYEVLLARELARRGFTVERQKPITIDVDGIRFDSAFTVDLLVEGLVVVEVKSVDRFVPAHWKQVLTYLRLLHLPLGYLLNFGCATMKEGLQRVVNDYDGGYGRRNSAAAWRSRQPSPPTSPAPPQA